MKIYMIFLALCLCLTLVAGCTAAPIVPTATASPIPPTATPPPTVTPIPPTATPPPTVTPIPPTAAPTSTEIQTTEVAAIKNPPTFQKVFDPAKDFGMDPKTIWGQSIEVFNNQLYVSVSNLADWGTGKSGLHLYRSADGQKWEAITNLGIDPNYWISWDMYVFKGKLYMSVHDFKFPIANSSPGPYLPGLIIRSANGTDWETVFQDKPDHQLLQDNLPDDFGEFQGMLYFTAVGSGMISTFYDGQIWRSPNGDPGSWQVVNSKLGDHVTCADSPVEFNGQVYVPRYEFNAGIRVWRSSDGTQWESVGGNILDDPSNGASGNLVVFKDYLYLGTTTYSDKTNYPGGRIYRTKDGQDWEMVVDHGFGSPNKLSIDSLFVYNGNLYAEADGANGVVYLYRTGSDSVKSWELVTPNGIDSGISNAPNMQVVFKDSLYLALYPAVYKMTVP